jgi:hypothetical protein
MSVILEVPNLAITKLRKRQFGSLPLIIASCLAIVSYIPVIRSPF